MGKKITIKIDDKLLDKIDKSQNINQEFINTALNNYCEQVESIDTVSTLKRDITSLQNENSLLEKERETLEINNICLKQNNYELQSRIDDLVEKYPSASILMGKTPEMSKQGLFSKIKKRIL
jgi:FtsZ-binding cell division protein ZapB